MSCVYRTYHQNEIFTQNKKMIMNIHCKSDFCCSLWVGCVLDLQRIFPSPWHWLSESWLRSTGLYIIEREMLTAAPGSRKILVPIVTRYTLQRIKRTNTFAPNEMTTMIYLRHDQYQPCTLHTLKIDVKLNTMTSEEMILIVLYLHRRRRQFYDNCF